MTTSANGATTNLARFQDLLRELFQFDCADLDFGIYRIMNHKRDAVERFIAEQLPASVASELGSGQLARQTQAAAELAGAARQVRENISHYAIDDNGALAEEHRNTSAGQRYLDAQSRAADSSRSRDAVEAAIYNHLYTFFSRYYDEGDFISKRRYSTQPALRHPLQRRGGLPPLGQQRSILRQDRRAFPQLRLERTQRRDGPFPPQERRRGAE